MNFRIPLPRVPARVTLLSRPEPAQSPSGTASYWYEANGRVLAIVEVTASDFAQPLDVLATKYPAPAATPVRKTINDIRRLECDP